MVFALAVLEALILTSVEPARLLNLRAQSSGATCVPTGCRPGGRPPNLRWRGKLYSVTSSRALLPTPLASFPEVSQAARPPRARRPWPGRSPSRAELLEELCSLTGDFEPHQFRPNPIDGANLVRRSVGII